MNNEGQPNEIVFTKQTQSIKKSTQVSSMPDDIITVQNISPRLSFKGYKFVEALNRNKDLIKGILILITGYSYFTGFSLKTFLLALGAALVTLAGKLILDAFDYFFSEVKLN